MLCIIFLVGLLVARFEKAETTCCFINPAVPDPPIQSVDSGLYVTCSIGATDTKSRIVPLAPASNEHCVQRKLPVRTVFFWDLINSVPN